MKKALLLLLLLFPLNSFAAITVIAAGHGCGGGVNAGSTSALVTTGGDGIYVGASWFDGVSTTVITGKISGVDDGNTYTKLTEQDDGATKNVIFYAKNANVGGSHVFTATGTGAFQSLCVLTVAGSNLTAPLDQQHGNAIMGGIAGTIKPGATTPVEDNEIIVTSVDITVSSTMAIDSGFTISDQINIAAGVNYGTALAYKIQTSLAMVDPTWDAQNISPQPLASTIASFKQAAAGGASSGSRMALTGAGH